MGFTQEIHVLLAVLCERPALRYPWAELGKLCTSGNVEILEQTLGLLSRKKKDPLPRADSLQVGIQEAVVQDYKIKRNTSLQGF